VTIDLSARLAFLKKIHLFHGLTDDELTAIAERLEEVSFAAGSVIFEQNKKPESFFLIYEGTVRITRRQDRKTLQLAVLVKDDYFGEMSLIGRRLRSGTAVAETDVSLLKLSREDFEKFFRGIPQLRLNFDLAVRSRQLARKLEFKWLRPDEVIYFLARKHPDLLRLCLVCHRPVRHCDHCRGGIPGRDRPLDLMVHRGLGE
jgi:signal-transduction protein with cAMP-binding, CBS, and nucleotidyltransferase domain